MTSLAVASIADAPGASTLSVGLVTVCSGSDQPPVLVEADPDGGRLGTRLAVGVEPGLMSLALASRAGPVEVSDVVAATASVGEWRLLPAPPSAEQTQSALLYSASSLAATIAADRTRAWVVDVGRASPRSPAFPFASGADRLLLVTRGDLAALQLVPSRVDALRGGTTNVSLVVVGATPWSMAEIAEFAGCDVAAHLPTVSGPVGFGSMHGRGWRRWWQAVGDLAGLVVTVDHRQEVPV
jgi:MinD-like ATPase involved in chromosome partitioning or flagellar assembly